MEDQIGEREASINTVEGTIIIWYIGWRASTGGLSLSSTRRREFPKGVPVGMVLFGALDQSRREGRVSSLRRFRSNNNNGNKDSKVKWPTWSKVCYGGDTSSGASAYHKQHVWFEVNWGILYNLRLMWYSHMKGIVIHLFFFRGIFIPHFEEYPFM